MICEGTPDAVATEPTHVYCCHQLSQVTVSNVFALNCSINVRQIKTKSNEREELWATLRKLTKSQSDLNVLQLQPED